MLDAVVLSTIVVQFHGSRPEGFGIDSRRLGRHRAPSANPMGGAHPPVVLSLVRAHRRHPWCAGGWPAGGERGGLGPGVAATRQARREEGRGK